MADHSLLRGILCNTSNLEKTPVTIINEVASTMRSQPDFRIEESFQSHSLQKSYCCTVRLCNGQLIGRGIGSNKRDAKQRASQHALEQLTTMINLTRHQVFLPVCRHSFQFCLAASFPVADTPLLFQFTTLPLPHSPSICDQVVLRSVEDCEQKIGQQTKMSVVHLGGVHILVFLAQSGFWLVFRVRHTC